MPCKKTDSFEPGDTVCAYWNGALYIGTYEKKEGNRHHIKDVKNDETGELWNTGKGSVPFGTIGKWEDKRGGRKTRRRATRRKTRRAQKPPRSRRTK